MKPASHSTYRRAAVRVSRRGFLRQTAAIAALGLTTGRSQADGSAQRRFHVCLAPHILDSDPDLVRVVANAGVSTVWIAGFFYGYWPAPIDHVIEWRDRIERAGMAAHVVNVPLGHPGDSLGAKDGSFPLSPPNHWKLASRPDGSTYAGTSLHEPATRENADALHLLQSRGVRRVFVDDDFRLAAGPGAIGGCFCDEHKNRFLEKTGFGKTQWQELLGDVQARNESPILRAWVDFTCDQLTDSFRTMQSAAPEIVLGNMVMYLGAEKAGIRLAEYSGVPLRVGELMFDDKHFAPVKGKTDELFSALFHRRYVMPELAYSETTAFPSDKLSAPNMAAKLAISTIADVRNTMFMSGVTPFPVTHWDTLAPAMKTQAGIHTRIAGRTPHGPLKHYWGEASRYVGDDKPYSLFLALGVPFEVTNRPAKDGWTFLSDADAKALAGVPSAGTVRVTRQLSGREALAVDESLDALFAWRRSILPSLGGVPYIEDEKPVVCAWYPEIQSALVWNLSETSETLSLRNGEQCIALSLGPLASTLVDGLSNAS